MRETVWRRLAPSPAQHLAGIGDSLPASRHAFIVGSNSYQRVVRFEVLVSLRNGADFFRAAPIHFRLSPIFVHASPPLLLSTLRRCPGARKVKIDLALSG